MTMADSRAHLRIENASLHGHRAKVFLNDQEITHQVSRVEVVWDCREINSAVITLLVDDLVVDGKTLIYRADDPRRVSSNNDNDG